MVFKKGDVVVCVSKPHGNKGLNVGLIYTVRKVESDISGDYTYLNEVYGGFLTERFTLLTGENV